MVELVQMFQCVGRDEVEVKEELTSEGNKWVRQVLKSWDGLGAFKFISSDGGVGRCGLEFGG